MKKIILILIVFALVYAGSLLAQTPPHPNGGIGPTGGNTPVGGAAPIGGGLLILLSLGLGYAMKRIYSLRKSGKESE